MAVWNSNIFGQTGIPMNVAQVQRIVNTTPTQKITIEENIIIGSNDVLDLHGKTLEIIADPAITIQGMHWTVMNGKLRAMTGVLFDCVGSSSGLILNVWAAGLLRSKELFRCIGTNQCYDTNVIGGEWEKPQSMTTPIVNVDVSGPFYNSNRWTGIRFQTNGMPAAPVMSFRCSHLANWIYGNTVDHINFEIPNAGAIHMQGVFNTSLRQINIFDADLFGPITDDIIRVTKGAGLKSRNTEINGYMRLSGTMNPGKYDINIPDSVHYTPNLRVVGVDGIDGALLTTVLPAWVDKTYIRATQI